MRDELDIEWIPVRKFGYPDVTHVPVPAPGMTVEEAVAAIRRAYAALPSMSDILNTVRVADEPWQDYGDMHQERP